MLYQFKPNALQKVSAKKLLIDDKDYSTPSDHYFAYVNKKDERPDKLEILKSLPMDSVIEVEQRDKILKEFEEKIQYSLFTGKEEGKPKYEKQDYE